MQRKNEEMINLYIFKNQIFKNKNYSNKKINFMFLSNLNFKILFFISYF
jgi:hypothetical protein